MAWNREQMAQRAARWFLCQSWYWATNLSCQLHSKGC